MKKRTGLIGTKIGNTSYFDESGKSLPVTIVKIDDQIKEKAELEKQFQDIAVLRQKVLKLQGELMASKKLEWIRRGLYGSARRKGGSKLMSMSSRKPKEESTIVLIPDIASA